MRTILIWGAGRIGRGFVGHIFSEAPLFRTVFADADAQLAKKLERAGTYIVARATKDGISETRIGGFEALHISDLARLNEIFLEDGLLLDIAVHEPKLPEVADMLRPLFELRAQSGRAMDVMMNVNMARPDERFKSLMLERLSPPAAEYFENRVGVTGIFAMCISPLAPDWLKRKDELALWNNGWRTQTISRSALKCEAPVAPRLLLTDDIEREETRKLYTLNMAHALLCYLGLPLGHKTSIDAVRDEKLRSVLNGALEESSFGLAARFGFGGGEMAAWRGIIVSLLENPYIEDDLQRLGADSRRKLGASDRLVGPARLCMDAGKAPANIMKAVRAAFEYENPDEGTRAVREYYKANGLSAALERFCGISPNDPLAKCIPSEI